MSSAPPAGPFPANTEMQESASVVEARLAAGGRVLVVAQQFQDELRTRGFGEKEDSDYVLKTYEALYLFHTKRLVLTGHEKIEFQSLFEMLARHDRSVMSKFLVYRDLRSRGYVAKEGFGFGIDFRVYERGDYEKKPAKYVIFAINEGTNIGVKSFHEFIEQIEKMGKEAVVAVIERRGEVIYYKASKMAFLENKYTRQNKE